MILRVARKLNKGAHAIAWVEGHKRGKDVGHGVPSVRAFESYVLARFGNVHVCDIKVAHRLEDLGNCLVRRPKVRERVVQR